MAEEKDTIGRDEPLNEEAPTPQTAGDAADAAPAADAPARAGKFDRLTQEEGGVRKLTGMYKNWFLDYASYVILERAVPHVEDGLKPVQRRILHAMKVVDDGRYNKVANIVGQTMQYHPHGDASIKDALVQLGQKDLLIDCQGNWGNILTGDEAAAGRYIEARLSKFASEVVFNKKTTEWMLSYDGRKEEPVTLPIKFPLLLAQGSDGIAVGLASKILPHNFVELINACIAHLEGREFQLYPDFPTGGMADVSRYNDGLRGGAVKVRAKISKIDKRTLAITEIPYTTTTESIKDSIIKANDKGKIKIRKVDDNTADKVEIVIQVAPDESSDKTIDALYRASQAGVKIDIVERGICALKPGVPGLSENIRVRSILGRFLEHSRIYAFANSDGPQIGEGPAAGPEVWIGSADLMHRNLDRRVEALVRITAPEQIDELIKYVDLQMADSTTSWHMAADGTYVRHAKDEEGRPLVDSQEYLIKKHTRRPARH